MLQEQMLGKRLWWVPSWLPVLQLLQQLLLLRLGPQQQLQQPQLAAEALHKPALLWTTLPQPQMQLLQILHSLLRL